jgi:hypothetical protein
MAPDSQTKVVAAWPTRLDSPVAYELGRIDRTAEFKPGNNPEPNGHWYG